MRPIAGSEVAKAGSSSADEFALLREENAALRRENRSLSIALAEMERIAERDMLTPLHNRRYFLSALHQRLARVSRYGDSMALVYVDVDGLKHINDTHGHAAGDFALIEIARIIASSVRTVDVLARIGGDEFGLILEQVTIKEAEDKLSRLMEQIDNTDCCYDGAQIALKASFGVTMIDGDVSAEDLLGRADAAMYAAKRDRRRCEYQVVMDAPAVHADHRLRASPASSAASSAAAR